MNVIFSPKDEFFDVVVEIFGLVIQLFSWAGRLHLQARTFA